MYAICDFCLEPIFDDPQFYGEHPLHSHCRDEVCSDLPPSQYPYELDGDYVEIGE